ncbi:4-diphosphocytidyl-2-C-methyl-D-erythritol kinase [Candidatus Arsenophonus lipoptenae]|uniref:4-diphosphocytidyl-2-C-methyl-D-erythritol kinase n=1 Tax=Candidatus Arsenophonus lipoptenae TaxID=634113 RepID=A0A0X8CY90_9GAMM|nr:4-(cytidine 5'-diphospho)-2-C-methyl-D-erythritol kinase [Candidatus Arsenophonus lipoptenae]AMA65082.1 4-diphosphocytidyl-2-C-methyl-D-erythritol kinase [Candidatus Arsenophonus lipoptenae]
MILTWPSPAKINLFLYITGIRTDGYHQLQTLFQFLNYGDSITIEPREDNQIKLMTSFINLPTENNLIIKAAFLFKRYCMEINSTDKYQGVNIYVDKRLPFGSGLGGGSSNAATMLIALNYYWKMNINDDTLAKLALNLGSDIPVFVKGHAAFAQGIGEQLINVNPVEKWYLVANPKINIITKKIFSDSKFKRHSIKRSLNTLLKAPYKNDCELIVRKRFPKVENIFLWLSEYASTRLTGTGSCVFAEFTNKSCALKVLNKAPEWMDCFVAKGINKSPLHKFRDDISRY